MPSTPKTSSAIPNDNKWSKAAIKDKNETNLREDYHKEWKCKARITRLDTFGNFQTKQKSELWSHKYMKI